SSPPSRSGSTWQYSSGFPGIDQRDTEILEVSRVARGERGPARHGDAGDLRVARFLVDAAADAVCLNPGRLLRRFAIEGKYAVDEELGQRLVEGSHQGDPPSPFGKKQQATLYLENAHRGRPQGRLRLA